MQFMSDLYRYSHSQASCLFLGTSTTGSLALFGQEDSLDVGQHTTLGNGHPGHELVKLLIIPER